MAENLTLKEKCIRLSQCILSFGTGINGRRSAQIVFTQLTELSADLGAGVRAMDYFPARSMRTRHCEELVVAAHKAIFLLNLALRELLFPKKAIAAALNLAVGIADDVDAMLAAYACGATPAAVAPAAPAKPAETKAEEVTADPDGFDAAYDGTL